MNGYPRAHYVTMWSALDVDSRHRYQAATGFQAAVLDQQHFDSPEILAAIRHDNPGLEVFFYLNPVELRQAAGGNDTIERGRLAWVGAHGLDYYLLGTDGEAIATNIGGNTVWELDITNTAYRAELIAWLRSLYRGAGFQRPRLFLDRIEPNVYYYGAPGNPYGNAPVAAGAGRDTDPDAELETAWQAGLVELLDALEAAGFELQVNLGWNSADVYAAHAGACMIEDFCMEAAPDDRFTWAGQMRQLGRYRGQSFGCLRKTQDPTDDVWLAQSRLAVTSSLVGQPAGDPHRGTGYGLTAVDPSYRWPQWSDYCAVTREGAASTNWADRGYGGMPLGPATVGDTDDTLAELLAGDDWLTANDSYHVRELDHVVAICNPTEDVIEIPNRWGGRQVFGVQDPVNLDGTKPDTITCGPRDGRILLKAH